ncbi:MAG: sigma-54-dependent transcriptional regulator [bacterium]
MEKILVVDNDEGLLHFLSRFFTKQGFEVNTCKEGKSALEILADEQFDLILMDYKMPEMSGLDILKAIKKSQVKTPIIIMTAYGTTETAIEAMKLGAYDYLLKPFDREELKRIAKDALEVNRLMKEVVSFPTDLNKASPSTKGYVKIIGNSKKMQDIYKLIGQIAQQDVTVLITGESGTGKELVARAIYHHSSRRDKPFLTVNCPAIPDTLFESELFGYERGAFTGAERTHIGRFERCHGGTLFFDEIGDMSLSTQAKFLRVLQEGELDRLGGTETIKVNVRVIAATNKNIEKEVTSGRFRKDLYWRLKIISLDLPPLRNRLEDIPALVEYFVAKFGAEYHKPIRYVDDKAVLRLQSYNWPGNVRELENLIRRAVLLCMGDVIREEYITLNQDREGSLTAANRDELIRNIQDKLEGIVPDILRLSHQKAHANIIDLVEELLISRAMKECGYNQVRAARMLGISRNTLRHRLKKYKIEPFHHENPPDKC